MDNYELRSAASILASVKEQEARFERLTRALEEECHSLALRPTASSQPLAWQQVIMQEQSPGERLSLTMMPEPEELQEATVGVTEEQDPGTPTSRMSAGTVDHTEAKDTKPGKMTPSCTGRPPVLGPDGLPLPDSPPPAGSYTDSIDRHNVKNSNPHAMAQASTLTRSLNSYNCSFGESPERQPLQQGAGDPYGTLTLGAAYRLHPPYTPAAAYMLPHHLDSFGLVAQPQAPVEPGRSPPEQYGLESDRISLGPEEEAVYGLEPDYATASRRTLSAADRGRPTREPIREPLHVRGVFEDHIEAELIEGRHPYIHDAYAAPLVVGLEHTAGPRSPCLDSVRKDPRWRDPDLPEVIGMLGHPVDPVKSNAAAYLQHLCYENDRIKRDVRQLKGVPLLVGLLDHPRAEVHRKACGALRNISYGRDHQNKVAIRNCDGIPALVRLLRKTGDMEVRELVTGTLWNLSSYEPLKMVIINHGLQTLTSEVIIPHSGWGRDPSEESKPRDVEWTTVFKNTSGCLRNVSSDGAEARRRLRECDGLVDALLFTLQSAINKKDTDNKSVENCVCILRNLSYHVHKEVPEAEKYQDSMAGLKPGAAASQKKKKKDDAGCFGGKKVKEDWFNHGWKNGESKRAYDSLDLPKRTEPIKGFQLLYQPEVVRLYLSLLTESQNYNTLEAAAGALQNLAAGHWTWSRYIRATVRKEKGLPVLVELLRSHADTVVRAVAIALRNLAIDHRNKDLIGSYALRDLVSNLPSGQQRPAKNLEEDTVVAILNTLHEIVTGSSENARSLIQAQAVQKLVAINRTSQSPRETKAASHVLQTVWSYKELKNVLSRDGWNKSHFQPTASALPKGTRNGKASNDDTTLPLMERSQEIYSTTDPRDHECRYRTGDVQAGTVERDTVKNDSNRKFFIRTHKPSVNLVDGCDLKPQPVDSWV
ncbi:armadillo repeat protein deleted in velo-cardio-facial syndrome homolog isoform X1 [Brienomyrus brachyistius]|uniref:armadillo repeat protein deleted in velo-cardio-facial syndrome homolog isoform X1 n=1 Tax=Brienomyrus brachyistius TaxID=42636 RepID=UPI0020B1B29F|nr:armadillo repeat protein deleted in velo-cardio-facial syndrome homolog isoform X1 [Brienomyrus brachyistius]XP_048860635.1 armadillo repeat protein deleted in velo-cardio-facial syndrome homolog isoform X1 [Brienomyrus brachyistius]